MGSGIAIVFLVKGYQVVLKEVNDKFLLQGVERVVKMLEETVKRRNMDPNTVEFLMRSFTPQVSYEGFDQLDLVIEAVIEDLPLKQSIFETLEKVCRPDCILATNTSTLDVDLVGARTKAQRRILGLHFFFSCTRHATLGNYQDDINFRTNARHLR